MPLSVACPSCGAKLRAQGNFVARTFKCPKCRKAVTVESPNAEAPHTSSVTSSVTSAATPLITARSSPLAWIAVTLLLAILTVGSLCALVIVVLPRKPESQSPPAAESDRAPASDSLDDIRKEMGRLRSELEDRRKEDDAARQALAKSPSLVQKAQEDGLILKPARALPAGLPPPGAKPEPKPWRGLVLLEDTVERQCPGDIAHDRITGVIENRTGQEVDWVEISFDFYDADGVLIDSRCDRSHLPKDGRWRFDFPIALLGPDYSRGRKAFTYKLIGIESNWPWKKEKGKPQNNGR